MKKWMSFLFIFFFVCRYRFVARVNVDDKKKKLTSYMEGFLLTFVLGGCVCLCNVARKPLDVFFCAPLGTSVF